MADGSIYAYVKLNDRIEPGTRGDVFEEPLAEAMEGNGLGEVTGGGTMQSPGGEIDFCGIDVELFDLERGVPFVRDFLRDAPQGSSLEYEVRGQPVSVT